MRNARTLGMLSVIGYFVLACGSTTGADFVPRNEDTANDPAPPADPPADPASSYMPDVPDAPTAMDGGAAANDGAASPVVHQGLLKAGLHPDASDALRVALVTAASITQTIGSASASAGTHDPDGTVDGKLYTAAVDLSVKGLSDAEIRNLLERVQKVGFAAWYRNPGHDGWPSYDVAHIHAVYGGCAMKLSLRNQIHDFCKGKNGLQSHTAYGFYTSDPLSIQVVRTLFLAHNPSTN